MIGEPPEQHPWLPEVHRASSRRRSVEQGRLVEKEVPMLNALNDVLRDDFIRDSIAGIGRWIAVACRDGLEMRRVFWLGCALWACGCGTSALVEAGADATSDSASNYDDSASSDGISHHESSDADAAGGGGDATQDGRLPTGDDAPSGADSITGADAATTGDGALPMDSGSSDVLTDVLTADGGCACQRYWCGCGPCSAGQIACTAGHAVCARGCASSCPELQQVVCGCDQGRCVRSGVDASIACFIDQDCPVGDCCAHVGSSAPDIASGTCTTSPNACCGAGCP
jgi:hypothetical protein